MRVECALLRFPVSPSSVLIVGRRRTFIQKGAPRVRHWVTTSRRPMAGTHPELHNAYRDRHILTRCAQRPFPAQNFRSSRYAS